MKEPSRRSHVSHLGRCGPRTAPAIRDLFMARASKERRSVPRRAGVERRPDLSRHASGGDVRTLPATTLALRRRPERAALRSGLRSECGLPMASTAESATRKARRVREGGRPPETAPSSPRERPAVGAPGGQASVPPRFLHRPRRRRRSSRPALLLDDRALSHVTSAFSLLCRERSAPALDLRSPFRGPGRFQRPVLSGWHPLAPLSLGLGALGISPLGSGPTSA